MENCPICAKHNNLTESLYETNHWIITHGPEASQILGYLYLEPKRHVENWTEMSVEELSEIGDLIKLAESALKTVLPIERLYTVTISEAVRHLHFHLITREGEGEVKGLPLIEQATQQKVKTNKVFDNTNHYNDRIEQIKSAFTKL